MEDVFQMEENECRDQKRLKIEEENPLDRQHCLGQWQWTRRGWRWLQEIQLDRKESKRTSDTLPSTWLRRAHKGSL